MGLVTRRQMKSDGSHHDCAAWLLVPKQGMGGLTRPEDSLSSSDPTAHENEPLSQVSMSHEGRAAPPKEMIAKPEEGTDQQRALFSPWVSIQKPVWEKSVK